MELCIVIPALNEEASIESTIRRSIAAERALLSCPSVSSTSIVVVSDGSTDATADLARRWEPRITLLEFDENRGYGAAIKAGWATGNAELLAFLDADGTCDPEFLCQLVGALVSSDADLACGSRLSPESKMPVVRRVGNRLFSWLLATLATRRVTDTASGMRVVRRSALPSLLPLPDGLHFTPAMTAIALLSDQVKLVEVPMPYHEREGESKLKVGRDGIRFLKVILQSAFLYRPARILAPPAFALGLLALILGMGPTLLYLAEGAIRPSSLPFLVLTALALVGAALFASAAYLCERLVLALLPLRRNRPVLPKLVRVISSNWYWAIPCTLLFAGFLLLLRGWPGLIASTHTGIVYNLGNLLTAVVCMILGVILALTRILNQYVAIVEDRLRSRISQEQHHLVG